MPVQQVGEQYIRSGEVTGKPAIDFLLEKVEYYRSVLRTSQTNLEHFTQKCVDLERELKATQAQALNHQEALLAKIGNLQDELDLAHQTNNTNRTVAYEEIVRINDKQKQIEAENAELRSLLASSLLKITYLEGRLKSALDSESQIISGRPYEGSLYLD